MQIPPCQEMYAKLVFINYYYYTAFSVLQDIFMKCPKLQMVALKLITIPKGPGLLANKVGVHIITPLYKDHYLCCFNNICGLLKTKSSNYFDVLLYSFICFTLCQPSPQCPPKNPC